jgi:hypothetical protein
VRDWEAAGEIGVVKHVEVPTIAEAVEKFFVDPKAQHLSHETIRKYENLLNRRFSAVVRGSRISVLEAARRRGDARVSRQLERQRELRDQESRAAPIVLPLLPAARVDHEESGAGGEGAQGQRKADAAVFRKRRWRASPRPAIADGLRLQRQRFVPVLCAGNRRRRSHLELQVVFQQLRDEVAALKQQADAVVGERAAAAIEQAVAQNVAAAENSRRGAVDGDRPSWADACLRLRFCGGGGAPVRNTP